MELKPVVARIVVAVAAGVVLGILVAATVSGAIRGVLNPRIVPRTLAGAGTLTLAVLVWTVAGIRSRESHPRRSTIAWPLLVPLLLIPAAVRSTSSDHGAIRLFTAGGSGSIPTAAAGVSQAPTPLTGPPATGTDSLRTGSSQTDAPHADDGSWVAPPNPDLLAEVGAGDHTQTSPTAPAAPLSDATEPGIPPDRRAAIAALAAQPAPIVIDTDTFSRRINLIWDDPEAFRGRDVEVVGFVYRRPDWPQTTFVVARMSIWCCAADAAVVGLLASVDDPATAPTDGQWVRATGPVGVRGTFRAGTTEMHGVPELLAPRWVPVDAPRFEYVFPEEQ